MEIWVDVVNTDASELRKTPDLSRMVLIFVESGSYVFERFDV